MIASRGTGLVAGATSIEWLEKDAYKRFIREEIAQRHGGG